MKHFVTGGTGFLGSHFIANYSGEFEICALVRPRKDQKNIERVLDAVGTAAGSYPKGSTNYNSKNVSAISGDIERTLLGVEPEMVEALRGDGVDTFWHFAASLNFQDDMQEQIQRRNINGVRNAIDLSERLGAKRFVYISTAYTAGTQEGEIHETLHSVDGGFNNLYEKSKCCAEHIVASECASKNLPFTILRPSVVVGVSSTYKSGGTSTGLYAFIRDLHQMKLALESIDVDFTLYADTEMFVNCIPVDAFINDIGHLIRCNFAGGNVFHSSASYGFRLGDGIRLISDKVGLRGLKLLNREPQKKTPIDELIGKRSEFYKSYMFHPKSFCRRIPGSYGVSLDDLNHYADEYLYELQSSGCEDLVSKTVVASDGIEISSYGSEKVGDRQSLLIINAFGMPVQFWTRLINRMSDKYNIYTWESRYLPGAAPIETTDISPERHAKDAIEVLDAWGVDVANVIGWCTGAKIALRVARVYAQRVSTVTLLSGGYNIDTDDMKTDYEVRLTDILNEIASDRDVAELYYNLIYAGGDQESSDSSTRSILQGTNAEYVHYTSLPFRSSENIFRYARLINRFYQDKSIDWVSDIGVPALLITAAGDVNTSPETTKKVSAMIPGSRLVVFDEGDHYLMDSDAGRVARHINAHINEATEGQKEVI